MKIINKIIFALLFSAIIFSCNTRKIGFFNNHYERYQAEAAPAVANDEVSKPIETGETAKIANEISSKTATIISKHNEIVKPEIKQRIASGVQSFKGATKIAKKAIKKDVKQALKTSKENRAGISNLLLVIIAILLPPLAVALVDGLRGPFWLDILLTILFYIPGLIYAIYRIFRNANA